VRREHDAPAARPGDQVVEVRPPLEIDVFGAQRQRLGQELLALLFRALKPPALPRGAAGDDDRACPSGECAGDARIADRVEPELDQVRVCDGVTPLAQLGRRRGRRGDTELRLGHNSQSADPQ